MCLSGLSKNERKKNIIYPKHCVNGISILFQNITNWSISTFPYKHSKKLTNYIITPFFPRHKTETW